MYIQDNAVPDKDRSWKFFLQRQVLSSKWTHQIACKLESFISNEDIWQGNALPGSICLQFFPRKRKKNRLLPEQKLHEALTVSVKLTTA